MMRRGVGWGDMLRIARLWCDTFFLLSAPSVCGGGRWKDGPKSLKRLGTQVQIEPAQFLIIAPTDEIITDRMNVHTGDPFKTGLKRFNQFLSCQIVQSDISLRCSKEPGFLRVESNSLNCPVCLAEGGLGGMFR